VTDASLPPAEVVLPWRRRATRPTSGFLSPAVRRVAAERNVDVTTLPGSGAGGRVTVADVTEGAGRSARVPLNRVQQRSGVALLASKATSAHAYAVVECDYERVEAVRRAERSAWRDAEDFSLTYLPFVARAVVDALRAFPMLNATIGEGDALTRHRDVNLGIAVDLAHQGLVVPVVRGADTLRLRGIARGVNDLASRARAKRLLPDDLSGGTFTITNPGASGTWMSFPIINQPQVAILSTDGVARRVVAGARGIEVGLRGFLCLAYDARVVDPDEAGEFLDHVATLIANRDWSAEL
jgi:2-oxoglutarate dehydrogenase E2 component (dihydrolipoamide succinyltransferase)